MQELRLVAVSEDGTYLVLATAGRGTRFTLPVDDRLRAAVRGHFSRLGQFEIEVESPLRPKEIQARIRSGETAEEIAESAGIPVERVRWFEGPVLQEREYMAQQAQRVAVRRPGESAPGPPLGETVEERLGRGGVDLEEAEWDSWKCEDNTWRVRLSFFDNGRPHAAEWTFDPRRRHVSPLDEIAARLTAAEWDDEPLSDTVTPLVPRRPAMTVVSSDRDRDRDREAAPRGLPAEPEQAERPEQASAREPLRAAEPRDYIVEPGPTTESRSPFRRPPEAVLREAARMEAAAAEAARAEAAALAKAAPPETAPPETHDAPETDDAAEAATGPPAALRPTDDAPDPAETAEPVRAAADVQEAPEPEETVQAEEPDPPSEATAEEFVEEAAEEPAEPEAVADQPEEAPAEKAPATEPRSEAKPAEPEPEPEPAPEPVEAEKAPAEKPAPQQRTAQRQSSRTPAKKKQPSRPAMPAAAQEKPATERPAAERPAAGTPAAAASNGDTAAPRPARRRKAKGKRASVPSWDEIMFGARRPE
ncbi:hypothetical protein GCM10022254_49780 [Actinomadura meridiana]|uniref:DUF3071 domain-containing protein n=1 Tax=Actinomadura meridiana TaxID=559626 RepID=A0ABP8CCD1_9ACTN